MGPRGAAGLALLALALLTAGCLATETPEAPTSPTASAEPTSSPAAEPPVHTLTIRAWDTSKLADVLAVEDVALDPMPRPLASGQLGPAAQDTEPVVLARLNVTEGRTLDAFRMRITVDDGLGPAEVAIEVPEWTANRDETVDVHLELVEVGNVEVDHLDGGHIATVVDGRADPRYGYLVWPSGTRQPLDGLERIVSVPADFPRFAPGAEPAFETDEPVVWRLDGKRLSEGTHLNVTPGPGKHTLVLADPGGPGEAQMTFSINDRFRAQGNVTAGSGPHRGSVAGVNEDTYNLSVHDGARAMVATLAPVGNASQIENLDLYALNASGGVVAQSTANGTEEIMRIPHGALSPLDVVELRVHGEKAAVTEYRLSAKTFYRPW